MGSESIDFNAVQSVVFGGGGVHGIAYIGVLESLFKTYGFDSFSRARNLTAVSGVSVGAFIGFFLACGFEFVDDMYLLFRQLVRRPFVNLNPFGFSIWGLNNGSNIKAFMRARRKIVWVCGAQLSGLQATDGNLVSGPRHRPDQLRARVFFGHADPRRRRGGGRVREHGRAPFFAPSRALGRVLVDGGIMENIPRIPEPMRDKCLVFRTRAPATADMRTLPEFIAQIVKAAMVARNKQDGDRLSGSLETRTITVDCVDVPAFNFSISELDQKKLMLRGLEAVDLFAQERTLVPCCRSRTVGTQTSPEPQERSSRALNSGAVLNPTPSVAPALAYAGTPDSPSFESRPD